MEPMLLFIFTDMASYIFLNALTYEKDPHNL